MVPISNTYLPLQQYDYIRFCTTLDDLDSSFYGGALIQITHISQSSNYDTTSSLSFYSVTGSITSGSLWRMMRRVPLDNFVLIKNIPSYRGSGLLIPQNYNPTLDPYTLARKAGLIQ